jgi:hypothetical protein
MPEQSDNRQVITLDEVQDPVVSVKLPDGTVKEFDPFELARNMEASTKANEAANAAKKKNGEAEISFDFIDAFREAVGIPDLSTNKCFKIWEACQTLIERNEFIKKMSEGARQNSSSSAGSNPPK